MAARVTRVTVHTSAEKLNMFGYPRGRSFEVFNGFLTVYDKDGAEIAVHAANTWVAAALSVEDDPEPEADAPETLDGGTITVQIAPELDEDAVTGLADEVRRRVLGRFGL